ncbi:hypothetical protein [Streptomyces avermitilis]|uniref:hypothetical protein n=1 Tax=Streptomyces avermitilis TaxID=33903 RepID=UPI0033E0382D
MPIDTEAQFTDAYRAHYEDVLRFVRRRAHPMNVDDISFSPGASQPGWPPAAAFAAALRVASRRASGRMTTPLHAKSVRNEL